MDLKKAFAETQVYNDEWNGEPYSFTARKSNLTPRLLQRFANLQQNPIELANGLASILTDWSIDLDGEPFPPTAENLESVPIEFLTRILEKLGETWGNVQRPSKSANG